MVATQEALKLPAALVPPVMLGALNVNVPAALHPETVADATCPMQPPLFTEQLATKVAVPLEFSVRVPCQAHPTASI
jgi:hypothetical protein